MGRGKERRRGCRLLELQEQGFVTVGLQLQLVCCAWVSSLGVLNLYSHLEPIREKWGTDAPTRWHWVSLGELQEFRDDRGGWYSACLGTSQIDSKVVTKWWSTTRGRCYNFPSFLKYLPPCILSSYSCSSWNVLLWLHFLSPGYSSFPFTPRCPLISPCRSSLPLEGDIHYLCSFVISDLSSITGFSCA